MEILGGCGGIVGKDNKGAKEHRSSLKGWDKGGSLVDGAAHLRFTVFF